MARDLETGVGRALVMANCTHQSLALALREFRSFFRGPIGRALQHERART